MNFLPAELIKKKRRGVSHDRAEIDFLIRAYVEGTLPDYQMSAWLMAVFFKGLNAKESAYLTEAMIASGDTVSFQLGPNVCDKHSTGGVGDKASLILAPIAAACGIHVPMIAGRGLGHTGGTVDKLEAIPGFSTQLSLDQFRRHVEEHHLSIIGQTGEICPADKKIYALRDVTGTIESLGLIGGSIMSKKIAEGIRGLALDVKVGNGAFMKTHEEAEDLARFLISIGKEHGLRVAAYITNMDQPLGRFIGNALEVRECVEIMQGSTEPLYQDTRQLSVELAALMIHLGEPDTSIEAALERAHGALEDGRAYRIFHQMVERQGGHLDQLPEPTLQRVIQSPTRGFLAAYQTEKIGIAGIQLGAGRAKTTDPIDPCAGIEIHKKIGDSIEPGEALYTIYGSNPDLFDKVEETLTKAVTLSLHAVAKPGLILGKIVE